MLDVTRETGNLMLFAGDQKVEHLNDDFYGPDIHGDNRDPEHLFRIADRAEIGIFASQLGLISLYGLDYPDIQYKEAIKAAGCCRVICAGGSSIHAKPFLQ